MSKRYIYRERFNRLVSELGKVPMEEAGEFSPEYVRDVIGCSLPYAKKLFREWQAEHRPKALRISDSGERYGASIAAAIGCRSRGE